jgi:hypothetical protein
LEQGAAGLARAQGSPLGRFIRRLVPAGLLLGLLVLIAFLFLPQPNVTDDSVASALQQQLSRMGYQAVVECDPDKGDWRCDVYRTSAEPSTCLRPTASALAAPAARTHFRAAAASATSQACKATKTATLDANVNAEQIDATLTPTDAASRERQQLLTELELLSTPIETKSFVRRFWDRLPWVRRS